jgi:hypothetical protein
MSESQPSKAELRRRKEQSKRDKANANSEKGKKDPIASKLAELVALEKRLHKQERRVMQLGAEGPQWSGRTGSHQLTPKEMSTILPGDEVISSQTYAITANSSAAGVITEIRINPGDPTIFPIGAITAQSWVRYDYRHCRMTVRYTPVSGPYNVASTAGDVFLAWSSDPSALAPSTALGLTRMQPAVKAISTKEMSLELTPAMFNPNGYLIRRGSYYEGETPNNFDLGNLYVGVYGSATTSDQVLGLISIQYSFKLLEQRLPSQRLPVPLLGLTAVAVHAAVGSGSTIQMAPTTAANVSSAFGSGMIMALTGEITLSGPGVYRVRAKLDPAAIASTFTGLTITSSAATTSSICKVFGESQNTLTWAAAAGVTDANLGLNQTIAIYDNAVYTFTISGAHSNTAAVATTLSFAVDVDSVAFST